MTQESVADARTAEIRGSILTIAAVLVWSGNYIVGRTLVDDVSPVLLAFWRWLFAFMAVLPFAVGPLRREWRTIRAHFGYYLVTALLGVTFFNTLIYMAAHTSPALNIAFIVSCAPLLVLPAARILYNAPLPGRSLLGLMVVLAGVVLLLCKGSLTVLAGLSFAAGDLFSVLSAICFAAYTLLVRKAPAGVSLRSFLAVTFGLGLLCILPLIALEPLMFPRVFNSSPKVWACLVFVGVGPSLFSFACWNRAISYIGPVKASILYYTMPLVSGVYAVIFLGEPILWVHFAGGGLIIAGQLLGTSWGKKK